jgi:hypothetical protein
VLAALAGELRELATYFAAKGGTVTSRSTDGVLF